MRPPWDALLVGMCCGSLSRRRGGAGRVVAALVRGAVVPGEVANAGAAPQRVMDQLDQFAMGLRLATLPAAGEKAGGILDLEHPGGAGWLFLDHAQAVFGPTMVHRDERASFLVNR